METTDINAKLARYDAAEQRCTETTAAELRAHAALIMFVVDDAGLHPSLIDWETRGELEQDYLDAQLASAEADAEFAAIETELYPPETIKAWEADFDAYLREQGRA